MGKTAHTRGPWFHDVDGFGSNRVGAFGFDTHDGTAILAQVRAPEEIGFEAAKANARLISAAPDLLEALEAFVSHYPMGINPMLDDAAVKARAAIARAKGGA